MATVDANGVVTSKNSGTAIIIAKTVEGEFKDSCQVNVTIPVSEVSLNKSTVKLTENKITETLIPSIKPENATDKGIAWMSSNEAVAVVQDGVVTTIADGQAKITVKSVDGERAAYCLVDVDINVPLTGLTLDQDNISMSIKGEAVKINAIFSSENAKSDNLIWHTSNPEVAFANKGSVVAVGNGTAVITAMTQDREYKASCQVTVDIIESGGLEQSGTCGADVKYMFNTETGSLFIWGNGPMDDYDSYLDVPWYPYYGMITQIVIEKGVTRIGNRAFMFMQNVESVIIHEGITSIGNRAFHYAQSLKEVILPSTLVTIEEFGFYSTDIDEIHIPASVISLGECSLGSLNFHIDIIYGEKGSAAERYAEVYGCTFLDSQLPVYDVTYDSNGGESAPKAEKYTAGKIINITNTVPKREGYSFIGWGMSPYLNEKIYKANEILTVDSGINLYAIWEKNIDNIFISDAEMCLNYIGQTQKLKVYAQTDDELTDVVWTSSNKQVAIVDKSGMISAVGSGTAMITATVEKEKTAVCEVNVRISTEDIKLKERNLELDEKGQTVKLEYSIIPVIATNQEVKWNSSDIKVP